MLLRQLLQERNLSVNRGLPARTQFTLVATGRIIQPCGAWAGDPCLTECQCVKWVNIMSGLGPMMGSCERGNGPPGSMNRREHLVPLCCAVIKLFMQQCCTQYQTLIFFTAVCCSVVRNLTNCYNVMQTLDERSMATALPSTHAHTQTNPFSQSTTISSKLSKYFTLCDT